MVKFCKNFNFILKNLKYNDIMILTIFEII